MQNITLQFHSDTRTFALITDEPDASQTVELFTAPQACPFNVCGLDCSALARLEKPTTQHD